MSVVHSSPLTYETLIAYLDTCILFWRQEQASARSVHHRKNLFAAECYEDAYQRVREHVVGSRLAQEIRG